MSNTISKLVKEINELSSFNETKKAQEPKQKASQKVPSDAYNSKKNEGASAKSSTVPRPIIPESKSQNSGWRGRGAGDEMNFLLTQDGLDTWVSRFNFNGKGTEQKAPQQKSRQSSKSGSNSSGKAASGKAATIGAKAGTTGGGTSGGNSANSGKAGIVGWGDYDINQYMMHSSMDDRVLESYDDMMKSEKESQKLVQLFFVLAKAAESGNFDMVRMFMRLVFSIMQKDKAKQSSGIAKKMLETQQAQRKCTETILGFQTNADDPNNATDFTKLMTDMKSRMDQYATIQKTLAGFLQDFTQFCELITSENQELTNARGRMLRKMVQWG